MGSFAEIVREHQSLVFSIAYHYLRDPAAAEELAQDVFLQLYRNLDALESPAHIANWLRRVAAHRSIDQARRLKLMPKIGLEQAPEPASQPSANDPLLRDRLRQLVGSLPEKWRMVVILKFQEGLEPDEIARTLDIPVGTVKSQLQRSLALLREKVTRTLGEVR